MEGTTSRLLFGDGRIDALGDQLDRWCDMLAMAGAASVTVGPAGGASLGRGPGRASPDGPGLHTHPPRPHQVARDVDGALAEGQGQLAGLTLPSSSKAVVTPSRPTRTVQRRKACSKKISATLSRDDKKNGQAMITEPSKNKHLQINYMGKTRMQAQLLDYYHVEPLGQNNVGRTAHSLNSFEELNQVNDGLQNSALRRAVQNGLPERLPHKASAASDSGRIKSICNSDTDLDSSDLEDFTDGVSSSSNVASRVSFKYLSLASGSSDQALEGYPGTLKANSFRSQAKRPNVSSFYFAADEKSSLDSVMISSKTSKQSMPNPGGKTYKIERSESRVSTVDGKEEKKKKVKHSIIGLVKPLNQDTEKEKFMKSENYQYNPQFIYKSPVDPAAWKKYFKPQDKLLYVAMEIMQNALIKHGSYEKFAQRSGGPSLTREQILEMAEAYLRQEGLEDEVNIKLSDDLVSRASMTRVKGRPLLQVQAKNVRTGWMKGLLRHEIGTHYLRSCNNRCQIWHKPRKRRDLELYHQNPTEEGLASLHSVIFRDDPCLWRAAMLYYTVVKSTTMSFSEVFHDLGKFVNDPGVKWDYCLRAKRGFSDTSLPGAFSKDQVYLKGALEILKNRRTIDFHALVRFGKVSYLDLDRLRSLATLENTRIPSFMVDLGYYHKKLDDILHKNGLTDEQLKYV